MVTVLIIIGAVCGLFSVAMFIDLLRDRFWAWRRTRHTRALVREMNRAQAETPDIVSLWMRRRRPVRPYDHERDGV